MVLAVAIAAVVRSVLRYQWERLAEPPEPPKRPPHRTMAAMFAIMLLTMLLCMLLLAVPIAITTGELSLDLLGWPVFLVLLGGVGVLAQWIQDRRGAGPDLRDPAVREKLWRRQRRATKWADIGTSIALGFLILLVFLTGSPLIGLAPLALLMTACIPAGLLLRRFPL